MWFKRPHTRDILFLLFVSFSVYLLSFHPIDDEGALRSVNSRSQYLITKSIVEDGNFRLDPYINSTIPWNMDVAFYQGHYYSTKPPGISLLAIPFYIMGKVTNDYIFHFTGDEKENWLSTCVLLASAFIGSIGVVAIYGICMELGSTRGISLLISTIGAFGTLLWVYNSTFLRHGSTATLLLLGFYFGFRAVRVDSKSQYFLCGIFLGYLVVSEYGAILLIVPSIIFFSSGRFRSRDSEWIIPRTIPIILGITPSAILLMLYNLMNFGSPISFSYSYSVYDAQVLGAGPEDLLLELSIIEYLKHFLFLTFFPVYKLEDRALFLLTPVLLFSLYETVSTIKNRELLGRDFFFFLMCFFLLLSLYSRWVEWDGGQVYGPRQILVVIPLLLFPLINYLRKPRKRWELVLFGASVLFSVFTAVLGAMAPWMSRTQQSKVFVGEFYLREWFFPWFAPLMIIILVSIAFFRAIGIWKTEKRHHVVFF
ncbi:MAG: hypothetical protein ACE5OZ_07450 [Candidatus Heimdallarchaeota archaeon]